MASEHARSHPLFHRHGFSRAGAGGLVGDGQGSVGEAILGERITESSCRSGAAQNCGDKRASGVVRD